MSTDQHTRGLQYSIVNTQVYWLKITITNSKISKTFAAPVFGNQIAYHPRNFKTLKEGESWDGCAEKLKKQNQASSIKKPLCKKLRLKTFLEMSVQCNEVAKNVILKSLKSCWLSQPRGLQKKNFKKLKKLSQPFQTTTAGLAGSARDRQR